MYPNLPLGESQCERQNNVAGSLRCSWEEEAGQWARSWGRGSEKEGGVVCVWKERERVSVQAREIVWRGREGSVSQSQHLSFSLHQGWGTLRPLASLAADLTPFHQRSHLFFSCFLLAAFDCFAFGIAFISFCMTGYKDLFIKNVGCPELQGGHLQRTVVKTAISTGIWSFFVLP